MGGEGGGRVEEAVVLSGGTGGVLFLRADVAMLHMMLLLALLMLHHAM